MLLLYELPSFHEVFFCLDAFSHQSFLLLFFLSSSQAFPAESTRLLISFLLHPSKTTFLVTSKVVPVTVVSLLLHQKTGTLIDVLVFLSLSSNICYFWIAPPNEIMKRLICILCAVLFTPLQQAFPFQALANWY